MRTAMMALLLALTCNLGVESLIGSFRTAFTNWLEQRLTADIYVRQHSPALTQLVNEGQEAKWIGASHERFEVSLRWNQRPTQVRGLDIDAPDTLTLPLAKTVPDAMLNWSVSTKNDSPIMQAPLILANEQVNYLGGINLGDRVSLKTALGTREFEVAGFFYDYGKVQEIG